MALTKKFRSTSGKPERLTMRNGHVAIVAVHWTELPRLFWESAYAAGCESEDMVANQIGGMADDPEVKTINRALDKRARIKTAILNLLEKNDVKGFTYYRKTKDYRPATRVIGDMIGSQITNSERDLVWHKMLEDGIDLPEFN